MDPISCAKTLRDFSAMGRANAPTLWFLKMNQTGQKYDAGWLRQDLAGFLITRGDHAFIGTGWMGGGVPPFPGEFLEDYGVPLGTMEERPSRVFRRQWSKGNIGLDCNTFTSTGIKLRRTL